MVYKCGQTDQIVSVRDLNLTYAGGQKVGFVVQKEGGLLNVNILKGYWLDTYLKGEKTGESVTFNDVSHLVDLGIGNIASGSANSTFVIEGTFNKPFDEIRLGCDGISVDAINGIGLLYAYVGENPMIPAVNYGSQLSTDYFNNKVTTPSGIKWTSWAASISLPPLIDEDLDNGVPIELISGIFQPYMTVDFGREIPAGSEVGYYITMGKVLDVSIAQSTEITTYDENNEEVDTYSNANIINLQVAGGGESILSIKTTKPCRRIKIQFWGINLNLLGVTNVHYAFVREKTEVDASSYFAMPDATVYNPTYRFALPYVEGVKVDYSLVSSPTMSSDYPEDLTPTFQGDNTGAVSLINMYTPGDYVVQAEYTYEDSENVSHTIIRKATITRAVNKNKACENTALVNTADSDIYEATTDIEDSFTGVQIGGSSVEKNIEYLVDENTSENWIEFSNVNLSLLNNRCIVGVKSKNGTPIGTGIAKKRVGFVIGRSSNFLNLDVLEFLRIKLLKNGQPVVSEVGDDNNGVSLGLIQAGNTNNRRVCLSIETDEEFDEIQLWYTGVLSVSLDMTLQVYYAYCEDATAECANPGEECMQLLTNANYGAVAYVPQGSVLTAGEGSADLGNIVDNSMDTYSQTVQVLQAVGARYIDVSFDKIKGKQEVGFVISNVAGLTDLGLIDVMDIEVYDGDNQIGSTTDETASGSALSLKVAGKGDRRYVSVIPANDFDKLRLKLGSAAEAGSSIQVHGIYILPDNNNDGVVDCVSDFATTMITGLYAEPADICEGDAASFRVDGGEGGINYSLILKEEGGTSHTASVTIESGRLKFADENFISDLKPGRYTVTMTRPDEPDNIWNGLSNGIYFTVHPDETTWTGKVSGDWNEWGNWTNGTPYTCTNVILPSPVGSTLYEGNVTNYPVLTSEAYCNHIHFETGAELINQHLLTYTQAFVDMEIQGGGYRLMSAPLRSMATGDMFVMENYESSVGTWEAWRKNLTDGLHTNYFTPVSDSGTSAAEGKYGVQRTSPCVYQRFWSSTVGNVTMTRTNGYPTSDKAIVEQTDWSRSFNSVSDIYSTGQGFAVKIDGNQAYRLHFPKSIVQYDYVTSGGNPTGTSGSVNRAYLGKLAKENLSDIVLYRESEGTKFLFGNPFMAHINVDAFFEANERITSIDVYDGTGYVTVQRDGTASADGYPTQIAPMEAVFLNVADPASSLEVHVDGEGLLSKDNGTAGDNSFSYQLRMTASRNGRSASCVVVKLQSASDGYRPEEDATLLAGSEEAPEAAVYTVADRKALSIQRVNGAARIPVGFCMKRTGDVDLKFEAGNEWSGWQLTDTQTGRSYPLEGTVSLDNVTDGTGRFYLEKR